MPFYEYQCSNCGHHHEELQKVTDRPLRKCPECGRSTLTRLMSAPVFRLKGGGWYETDFKSDKEDKRNLAGEKEPAGPKPETAEKPAVADQKPEAAKEKPAEAGKTSVAVGGKPATAKKAKPPAKRPGRKQAKTAAPRKRSR